MHGHLKSEVIIGTITLVSMDEEASKFGLRVFWTSTKIQSLFGTDFVSNNEVLRRTDLFDVSYIIRKRRLGLFGHVARLRSDVPANQILQICTKTRDERPSQKWRRACGRPSTTWTHQICRDTGVTATEALQLAEDRPFWRTIATAGGLN